MRVLDLDLDFFISAPCELAPKGQRPDISEAQPWPAEKFREFLEHNCGLSRERPVPGAIFATHDMALDLWEKRLEKPFHVTHIDAHSDLGIGKPGPAYVLESVITRKPQARGNAGEHRAKGKLDEANYLLFALAFRYINSLENVRHPASRPDMPSFCREGFIRLESAAGQLLPVLNHNEPAIPYTVYADYDTFKADAPYDLATLAISPRYAPKEADALAGIFLEYITQEAAFDSGSFI